MNDAPRPEREPLDLRALQAEVSPIDENLLSALHTVLASPGESEDSLAPSAP